jgi:L-lactate dehydrogenase complex protein LldG
MSGNRAEFLERVRSAVTRGNQAGVGARPTRDGVGYQGAGADLVERFLRELVAAGGQGLSVSQAQAVQCIEQIALAKNARRVLLGRGSLLDSLELATVLGDRGLQVSLVDQLAPDAVKPAFFAADLGISCVEWAIAETGTLVMASRPSDPRSLSLLPPVHIAVVGHDQLLPDLFDLFDRVGADSALPACISLITGPSKTGDIELKLVTGVHGPGEVHVLVVK